MIKDKLKGYIVKNGNSHILIHSNILFGFNIKFENHENLLLGHYLELKSVCQSLKMVIPSFNYDFCKGSPYDLKTSESQVGAFSEYFRKYQATWRTSTPVFNFSGTGDNPQPNKYGEIDPFDENSVFGFLHNNKGLLMHYGSGIHTSTLIHYVERISNRLMYRYDKVFSSQVIDFDNVAHDCELFYHVRPMGYKLDYDWSKLEIDLIENNIIEKYKEDRTQILIGRIDKIVDFWLSCLIKDPLYFLNIATRNWVEKKYKELNRKFLLTDFE